LKSHCENDSDLKDLYTDVEVVVIK